MQHTEMVAQKSLPPPLCLKEIPMNVVDLLGYNVYSEI